MQMGLANMLIHTINPPLQDREIPLNGVGIGVAPHVLLGGMVDGLMGSEPSAWPGVDVGLIRVELAVWMGMPRDDRGEGVGSDVRDVEATDLPFALDQGENGLLRRDRPIRPVFGLPPIQLSSASSVLPSPPNFPPVGHPRSLIASRMRWVMNQADLYWISRVRMT